MEEKIQEKVKSERPNPLAPNLRIFNGVQMFKSVGRAIRRGHMSPGGVVYPSRPFNNRANTCNRKVLKNGKKVAVQSRYTNYIKKVAYGKLYNKTV